MGYYSALKEKKIFLNTWNFVIWSNMNKSERGYAKVHKTNGKKQRADDFKHGI